MTLTLTHITFDCADAAALAGFWAAATGLDLAAGATPELASIGPEPDAWFFVQVPEAAHEKVAKNRVHLDLTSADRVADVARLTALGARPIAEHTEGGTSWTVMADPAGNEFCVI
jgi:hypothetical protein